MEEEREFIWVISQFRGGVYIVKWGYITRGYMEG